MSQNADSPSTGPVPSNPDTVEQTPSPTVTPLTRFRWKLGLAILLIGVLLEVVVWQATAPDRTFQVMYSFMIIPTTAFLLLLWWLFLSGLPRKTRLKGFLALGAATGVFFAFVRFEGFWGDMVPRFGWRWNPSPEARAREFWKAQGNGVAIDGIGDGADADLSAPELVVTADDWPEFRGRNRDGVVPGLQLRRDWDGTPPKLLWRQPVGLGWSSFAVVGSRVFTQEQRDADEVVVCYDLETGRQLWTHADKARFSEAMGGDGPRATPTVFDGRLYTLGATGILNCLDAVTGRLIWSTDILDGSQSQNLPWGMAGSPLVYDDVVVANPGRGKKGAAGRGEGNSLIAFNWLTGEKVWSAGSDPAGYVAPMLVTLLGERQIVLFDGIGVKGHDPNTGAELWRQEWFNSSNDPMINAAQPVLLDDATVFIGSGYGQGSTPVRLERDGDQWSAQALWTESRTATQLKLKFSGPVVHEGYIYGFDESILTCMDPATGRRQWKQGRYGYGQLLLVGDILLIQAETGEVVLVEANPNKFHEIGRFQAIEGKTWNHPVVVRNRLLVRNAEEAACYDLDSLIENHQNDR